SRGAEREESCAARPGALDVTGLRNTEEDPAPPGVEVTRCQAAPNGVVERRRNEKGWQESGVLERAMAPRGVAVQHSIEYEFGLDGFPRSAAVHRKAELIGFHLDSFDDGSDHLMRQAGRGQAFAKAHSQVREVLLLPANAFRVEAMLRIVVCRMQA